MENLKPSEFCPAAAIAAELARLETLIQIAARLGELAGRSADCAPLLRGLEAIGEDLMMAADEARDRLAGARPASAAGAIAQLLGAIRDVRVCDDAERLRALAMEESATSFAAHAGMLDLQSARRLSQTRFAQTDIGRSKLPQVAYNGSAP